MLTRWMLAALMCCPMGLAIADDDTVPEAPPVPDIDDSDWDDFGNDIGDFFGDLGRRIGNISRDIGQSVGRSFRFSDDESYNLSKADGGNYSEINELRSIRPGGTIEIDNIVGIVKVEGWKRDEIEIKGRLGEDVERLLFDIDGKDARIKVVVPKGRNRKIKTELIVHVPQNATLEIHTISAPIEVDNVQGGTHELETVSSPITINNTSGELDLQTISGRITVEGADSNVDASTVSGSISIGGKPESVEAETVSGRIELNGVQNRASTKTISGRITIEAKVLSRINSKSISGAFTFEGGLSDDAEIDISSLSGTVRLNLSHPINGHYSLQSRSGSKHVQFGKTTYTAKRGKNLVINTHKSGDADVRIESFSGSINISD